MGIHLGLSLLLCVEGRGWRERDSPLQRSRVAAFAYYFVPNCIFFFREPVRKLSGFAGGDPVGCASYGAEVRFPDFGVRGIDEGEGGMRL